MTTTIKRRKSHFGGGIQAIHAFGRPHEIEWPQELLYGSPYGTEEELLDQLNKLPSSDQVEELCSVLRVAILRELSSEVVNGSIDHLKQKIDRLEYIRLLNSWIASAEETVAAGKNVNRIAARRRKNLQLV